MMSGAKARSGGTRPGAGAPIRYIRIRVGDTFAALGRGELVTVVSVERGGMRLRFEGGEELALVERFRTDQPT